MKSSNLVKSLLEYGLSEYFILHIKEHSTILGRLVFDKGRTYLRDSGYLSNMKPEVLKPCWDKGLIGMVTITKNRAWESLTFYGLEKCRLPVDLESTRHGIMMAAQSRYGERLIDFEGSIYRGYNLMLHNNFLPVILLNRVTSKNNEPGLIVTDLRTAPMDIKTIQKIHETVRDQVDKRPSMVVEDTNLNDSDFEDLFKQYLDNAKK